MTFLGPRSPSLRERTARSSLLDGWHSSVPHNYLESSDRFRLPFLQTARPESLEIIQEMDISSKFGRRVRALRRERNMTQTEMAKKFGIDRSYISDLERGKKSISLPMVEIIALGMKISISLLFENL